MSLDEPRAAKIYFIQVCVTTKAQIILRGCAFQSEYNIGLKTLLQQGISEPIFYGDLVYKLKRIVGNLILMINSKR